MVPVVPVVHPAPAVARQELLPVELLPVELLPVELLPVAEQPEPTQAPRPLWRAP